MQIFCSYSHRDHELKRCLEAHLSVLKRAGKISIVWSDDGITAGTELDAKIKTELCRSRIVLLLLSSDYVNSAYCWDIEAKTALALHDEGKTTVISVVMRPVNWKATRLAKYKVVPKDGKAVTSWENQDEAFLDVVSEIERVLDELMPVGFSPLPVDPAVEPAEAEGVVFHCVPECGAPVPLRVAGLTELLPDLVLRFRGDPGERRVADIRLYANTRITSRCASGALSEAFLSLATSKCVAHIPTLGKHYCPN